MKKKLFGILGIIMLSVGFIIPSGNAFATTIADAEAACKLIKGSYSTTYESGLWGNCANYSTSGYDQNGVLKYQNACKLFKGTSGEPTHNVWTCQNVTRIQVDSSGSGSGAPTAGSNPTSSKPTSGSPTAGSNPTSVPTSPGGGGGSTPTYNPGTYTGATTNTKCGGVKTAIIGCSDSENGDALFAVLALLLNIVTYGVGAAAVVGVIITGFQYMSARDNPAQVVKAKNRLLQVVIGLVIWILFWGVLQFLLPGGLFGDGS